MAESDATIQVKRSTLDLDNNTYLKGTQIHFGEPVFVDNSGDSKGEYLVVGKKPSGTDETTAISDNKVVRLVSKTAADGAVYNDASQLKDLSGNAVNPKTTADNVNYSSGPDVSVKTVLDSKVNKAGINNFSIGYDSTTGDVYVNIP